MRIVSLLPSLTELVCALGHRESLVGVTHECDYPEGIDRLPHLTRSRIPTSANSAEIDAMVAEQGGSLYDLDADLLASLQPDLILTQSQCDVCAVNEGTVRRCAAGLPGSPPVESVNPLDWRGVAEMFRVIGHRLNRDTLSEELVRAVESETVARQSLVPVLLLEWLDPPYIAGHWVPDLIRMAGGRDVLGKSGEPSRRATWAEIVAADPEVILLSPCGFTVERSEQELPARLARPEWRELRAVREGRVMLVDGSAYFSRPGPRLRDSVLIAAAAIDSKAEPRIHHLTGWKRLPAVT